MIGVQRVLVPLLAAGLAAVFSTQVHAQRVCRNGQCPRVVRPTASTRDDVISLRHMPADSGCDACAEGLGHPGGYAGEPYGGDCCHGCGCDPCGPPCCPPCCCEPCDFALGIFDHCHCPRIRVRGEYLPLHRTAEEGDVEIDPLIDPLFDFEFTFESGVRVGAEVCIHGDHSLEAVYFGLHEWEDTNQLLFMGSTVTTAYSSELHGGEINYWCPVTPCCSHVRGSLMFGARYINLREDFAFTVSDPTPTVVDLDIETRNDLIGVHIGWMLSARSGHGFGVRWDVKAGVAANLVEKRTSFLFIDDGVLDTALSDKQEETDAAFIGDTSVVVSYDVTPRFSIYAGYYLLWVDGLALAPDQFDVSTLVVFPGPTTVNHNGFVFFQGAIAGAEVTF